MDTETALSLALRRVYRDCVKGGCALLLPGKTGITHKLTCSRTRKLVHGLGSQGQDVHHASQLSRNSPQVVECVPSSALHFVIHLTVTE